MTNFGRVWNWQVWKVANVIFGFLSDLSTHQREIIDLNAPTFHIIGLSVRIFPIKIIPFRTWFLFHWKEYCTSLWSCHFSCCQLQAFFPLFEATFFRLLFIFMRYNRRFIRQTKLLSSCSFLSGKMKEFRVNAFHCI